MLEFIIGQDHLDELFYHLYNKKTEENLFKYKNSIILKPHNYTVSFIQVRDSAAEPSIPPLVNIQKVDVNFIVSAPPHFSNVTKLILFNTNKTYLYNVALFMFKFENGYLPNIFNNHFFCQN